MKKNPLNLVALGLTGLLSMATVTTVLAQTPPTGGAAGAPQGGARPNIQQETHGDWQVRCGDVPAGPATGDAPPPHRKMCVMSQEQTDGDSKQRVMAVEMIPDGQEIQATFILPFGLSLQKGVNLQIDNGRASGVLPFRTCLPIGCILPIRFDPKLAGDLRKGSKLNVTVTTDAGEEVKLAFSLSGFTKAIGRASELAKS
jgi:invasion protein IalB